MADLPYPDATFALATALSLIEYLGKPAVAVRELARVLRPGGQLVVTSPNKLRLTVLLDPVGVIRGPLRESLPGDDRRYLTADPCAVDG